jgi:hypothetical protein
MPGCVFCIRGFQHPVPSAGIRIPFTERGQVHHTKFPLPQWVLNARLMMLFSFLIGLVE